MISLSVLLRVLNIWLMGLRCRVDFLLGRRCLGGISLALSYLGLHLELVILELIEGHEILLAQVGVKRVFDSFHTF